MSDVEDQGAGTEAGDPEAWIKLPAGMKFYGVMPEVSTSTVTGKVDSLDDADRAYVWEDANGVHWGWVEHNGFVAWSSAYAPYGQPAVGPFVAVYENSNYVATQRNTPTSGDAEAGEVGEQTVDMVEQPAHYNQGPPCKGCGRPIECLDITEHMNFCLGNTVKYVWRCDLKHDAIEDLRKARKYLDTEIARREAQLVAEFKNRTTTKG